MTNRARNSPPAPVFDAAEAVLREDGPAALSVRRVAEAAHTSTQAVYTQFGGKPGLADALYREGYRRLADRIAQLDLPDDPLQRIRLLGTAYRDNALANAHLYDLMTARPLPEYQPPPASRRAALHTMEPLVQALGDAIDADILVGDPHRLAHELWAAGHGLISLTLNGMRLDDDDAGMYQEVTEALIDSHRAQPAP